MRCVCGNKEFIPWVTGKYGKISFIISKCTKCGLRATTQPKLNIETPDYESGELYPLNKKVEIGASTRHNSSLKTISQVVKRFFNDKEIEVLDFGCSRGEMARYILLDNYLNEKISKIKGIDLSLKHPWADDKITLKRQDLFDVYEKYDLIYSLHVFEHLYDFGKYLDKCLSILKEGGILILAVPNTPQGKMQALNFNGLAPDEHIWHFDKISLSWIFDNRGIKHIVKEEACWGSNDQLCCVVVK